MKKIQTEILVIGGGATGTGVVRDLALRGFQTVLVEKGDLTHGTTGRYHGLLHSGGRYVVRDPLAARECIEENRILRRILPHCIEDTGGFFVLTPWDDPAYAGRFVAGCQAAGIPVEELDIAQMLREEPRLNPQITRCFRVPDGSADSFLAADANAESARQHSAQVLPYHQVETLLLDGARRVCGARLLDRVNDEALEIHADLVVNAAGAWAGQVAASAGISIRILPGKGVMLAANHRVVNTVINRCKLPGDGDILVPAHTVSVIGTTDVKVDDPDHFAIEPWEVELMLAEGEKMLPGFRALRMLRAWAGVRPLYQETRAPTEGDNRQVTRAFVLLDHEDREGVPGLLTITSGKWTTYRKMAEVTADLACSKLGVTRPCTTHLEALPGAEAHGYHVRGGRLAGVEQAHAYGRLVCECELATVDDVEQAIAAGARTIDDVRRDARVGMGPCQGGFCTYRVAGMLQVDRRQPVEQANLALRDFLQERWKGLLPVLWGQQLRQERLDELIYLSVLAADRLPGPDASPLAPVLYAPGAQTVDPRQPQAEPVAGPATPMPAGARVSALPGVYGGPAAPGSSVPVSVHPEGRADPTAVDLLVVGAGLAGLATAWQASLRGRRVRVVAKGWGANHWNAGCIDVLGWLPGGAAYGEAPLPALGALLKANPRHPYALTGLDRLAEALQAFQALCAAAGYPLQGSLERNWLLPTALGALRPTCLVPETMTAGDAAQLRSGLTLVAGFKDFPDFYPEWTAANLTAQGFTARGLSLDLPSLRSQRFITGRVLAQRFDRAEFRAELAAALKPRLGEAARVGFPAVLGLQAPLAALRDLEAQLGRPVFEIPGLPPSIPGIRLHNLLVGALSALGVRIFDGMLAVEAGTVGGRISTVWTEAAARRKAHRAGEFVLATGGFLGGGLRADEHGRLYETVFGLPVAAPAGPQAWFQREFLAPGGHPVYSAGVSVDSSFQPLGLDGHPGPGNLYVAGGALAGCDPLRERSLEGVALATGYAIGGQV